MEQSCLSQGCGHAWGSPRKETHPGCTPLPGELLLTLLILSSISGSAGQLETGTMVRGANGGRINDAVIWVTSGHP